MKKAIKTLLAIVAGLVLLAGAVCCGYRLIRHYSGTIDSDTQPTIDPAVYEAPFTFTTRGQGSTESLYCVTSHTANYEHGWLYLVDRDGNQVWMSDDQGGYCFSFRRYVFADGTVRYAYQVTDRTMPKANTAIEETHVVVLDESMQVIRQSVTLLPSDRLPDGAPCENHEYLMIDDDHFVLTAAVETMATVDGIAGEVCVFDNVIQEQVDGRVVWEWHSIDHQELFGASIATAKYPDYASQNEVCLDYAHINSVSYDAADDAVIISFRHIGVVSVDYTTGNVNWILGTVRNDIKGATQVPYLQHDARVQADGSILLFDNAGCAEDRTRIQRFLIDTATCTLVEYREYLCPQAHSAFMGSAQLLDDQAGILLVAYGGRIGTPAFEELQFGDASDGATSLFSFSFDCGEDVYAVQVGNRTDAWHVS